MGIINIVGALLIAAPALLAAGNQLEECEDGETERFVANDHFNGLHIQKLGSTYGIVINELFNNPCIDNDQLKVGYNGFSMRDVTVEIAKDGSGKRMFGTVELLSQLPNDIDETIITMDLAAQWNGPPGTFTILETQTTRKIYGGYGIEDTEVSFYATFEEVVNVDDVDPLVIELKDKPDEDKTYTYTCAEDALGKNVHACHGWVWSRIGSAGRYGTGTHCDRCEWAPMPTEDTDFLFEIERICQPARTLPLPEFPSSPPLPPPVCCPNGQEVTPDGLGCQCPGGQEVTPDGKGCESVCGAFSVEHLNSQCENPSAPDGETHVFFVPNKYPHGGSYKFGQGALVRPESGKLHFYGAWSVVHPVTNADTIANVDVSFMRVVRPDPEDIKTEHPCNTELYKYYTLDTSKTNTITYTNGNGLAEIWDIEGTPMYAQEGIGANSKDGKYACCGDEVPGFSSWLHIKPQGSGEEIVPINVDINAHLICADCDERYEYATTNRPNWIGDRYGFENGFGLAVNEMFKDNCITISGDGYNNLDFGYSSFDFVGVKTKFIPAEVAINGINRIEMKGTVKAYVSIKGGDGSFTNTYLFDMYLDAFWEDSSLVHHPFGIKGSVFGLGSSRAYLTEIVGDTEADPLIVELVGKPTTDGTEHTFRCAGNQCFGWTMAKIVQRGRYASADQCECEPKAVQYSDWGLQLQPDCDPNMPVVPEVELVEEVCCPVRVFCVDDENTEGKIRNGRMRVENIRYRIVGLTGTHKQRAAQLGLSDVRTSDSWYVDEPFEGDDPADTFIMNLSGDLGGSIKICGEVIELYETGNTCRCVGDPHDEFLGVLETSDTRRRSSDAVMVRIAKNDNGGLDCDTAESEECLETTQDSAVVQYQTKTVSVVTVLKKIGIRGKYDAMAANRVVAVNAAGALTYLDKWTYICEPSVPVGTEPGPPICKLYVKGEVYDAPLCIKKSGNLQKLHLPSGEEIQIKTHYWNKHHFININSMSSNTAIDKVQGVCQMQSQDSIAKFADLRRDDVHEGHTAFDKVKNEYIGRIDLPECEALGPGWTTVYPESVDIADAPTRRRRALEEEQMPAWVSMADHHIHIRGSDDDNEMEDPDDPVIKRRSTGQYTILDAAAETETDCKIVLENIDADCQMDREYGVAPEACDLESATGQLLDCLKQELQSINQEAATGSVGSGRRSADYIAQIRYLASLDPIVISCASDMRDYDVGANKCLCPKNRSGATCAVKKGQKVRVKRAHKLGPKVKGKKRRIDKGKSKKNCVDSEGAVSFELDNVDLDSTCDVSIDGEMADASLEASMLTVKLPKLTKRKLKLVLNFKGPGLADEGYPVSMKLTVCK